MLAWTMEQVLAAHAQIFVDLMMGDDETFDPRIGLLGAASLLRPAIPLFARCATVKPVQP